MAELSKVNVSSTDYDLKDQKSRDALVDVVNDGAKNLSQFNSGTAAADNATLATGIPLVGHAGEVLVFSYETTLSSGVVTVGFKDANGNATGSAEIGNIIKQKIVTIPEGTAKFNVFVSKAGTYTNFMICTKADWDISQAYVPYGMTNAELTPIVQQNRSALIPVVDKGAKNLLKLGFTHKSSDSQTADMTADGNGIIVNGDRNATTDAILVYDLVTNQSDMRNTRYTLPAGKYVMTSTGTSNLRYQVYCHDGTNYQSLGYTMSNPLEFDYTSALKTQYPYIAYRLWVSRVSSFSNLTVYPMVCSKEEWDISQAYAPYGKTNAELTKLGQQDRDGLATAIDKGAKNILNVLLAENYRAEQEGNFPITTGNVTFSENGGVITTSGTASVTLTLRVPVYLPIGTYYISGSPVSGSDATYRTDLREQRTNVIISSYRDYGSGFEVEITTARTVDWCIRIQSGFDTTGLIFYPMICTAAAWKISQSFQPFARTNRDLTVLTDEDRESLVELVDGGSKNRLKVEEVGTGSAHGTTYENNGVTYTVNNDGTVSLSGTASAQSYANLRLSSGSAITIDDFCNDNFVLSGCPFGGSESFCLSARTTNNTFVLRDTGNGVRLTNRGSYSGILVTINVPSGKDCSGVVFRPMICTDAAWKISQSFQPYRPSWQEMYAGEFKSSTTSLVDNLNTTFIDKANSRLDVYKYGKICFADIALKTNSSALTGNDAITTTAFPAELRPQSTIYATLTACDTGSWILANLVPAIVTVDTNGAVSIRTGAVHSSTEYIVGFISWLAAI